MTRLKLRRVAIDTYKENVAYLHRECALYRSEGFQALNKIEVHSEEGSLPVIAVLNVVVDKHCIGGIPGNRTTMLVVPIVVSRSMLMPKTSSRVTTSPAGPADTLACKYAITCCVLSQSGSSK